MKAILIATAVAALGANSGCGYKVLDRILLF